MSHAAGAEMAHEEIASLNRHTREQLLQLACVAAWSDTIVVPAEREVVLDLVHQLALGKEGEAQAKRWLDGAPPWFDPQTVEPGHRQLFLDALQRVIRADGRLAEEECETLRLMKELLI